MSYQCLRLRRTASCAHTVLFIRNDLKQKAAAPLAVALDDLGVRRGRNERADELEVVVLDGLDTHVFVAKLEALLLDDRRHELVVEHVAGRTQKRSDLGQKPRHVACLKGPCPTSCSSPAALTQ